MRFSGFSMEIVFISSGVDVVSKTHCLELDMHCEFNRMVHVGGVDKGNDLRSLGFRHISSQYRL